MKIITGMHRSGTSFVANIIHALGLQLGPDTSVVPTDCWNAAGYYENLELVILNDRIILGDWKGLERFRQTPSGRRPFWLVAWVSLLKFRYGLFQSAKGIPARAFSLRKEIKQFAEQNATYLLKDPRFSLTLEAWRRYGDVSEVLYSFRHPMEVAQSLRKREKIPLWLGFRIWGLHVESFLQQSKGIHVTYVNFNNFFDPGLCHEEIMRCFAFAACRYNNKKADEILSQCLRRDLKNNQFDGGGAVPEKYIELYSLLKVLHHRQESDVIAAV